MTLQLHQLAPGHHYFTQDVFPQPMLRETLIYEDFYKKLGFAYFAAANLNAADGGVGFLSIARSESDGPFQQNERQMMQALAPHIARAVRIHASFADLPNPAAAISRTEQWPTPWLLVDGLGRILFRNTAAEAVQKDAVFEDDSGYLKLPDAQAQRTLREMLRWTAQDSPMRLQQPVRCRASLGRVLLTCFPVSNDSFSSFHSNLLGPRFGVTLHVEGTGVALNDAWLMELFDFTRAEARMAVQLARGLSQAEIAQHLHLSIDSVRTHTKRLLAKAGVRSQAALLAKLFATFSGPAGSAVD